MTRSIDEAVYQSYLDALLAGDRATCTRVVQDLVAAGTSLKNLYVNLFQRALYAVGALWENQKISVAIEHLATAITQRMLTLVQPQSLSVRGLNRTIIIACVTGDYHQIGARMIADLCELRGWRSHFLGPRKTVADLLQLIEEKRPHLVGLSIGIYFNQPALVQTLDTITIAHPDLPVLVGGQALRFGSTADLGKYPAVSYVATIEELEQRLSAYER